MGKYRRKKRFRISINWDKTINNFRTFVGILFGIIALERLKDIFWEKNILYYWVEKIMKSIFWVSSRKLNVSSIINKIFVENIGYLLCFGFSLTIIKNTDGAILGNSFEEISFFIHSHVLFNLFKLFWKWFLK